MLGAVVGKARFLHGSVDDSDRKGRRMQTSPAIETEDKDLPLREDIRLLGRILGDTIREQGGEAVFETVENIRQNSVRFRRDEDLTARRDLEATLNGLMPKEALQIIRAFGFFSHLANIAEDQHHIRRTRAHSLSAATPREGTIAHSLARARQAGIPPARLDAFFAGAMVVPVLTAHPTEVRRKSTIDREMEVAELIAERDRSSPTAAELAANEAALRRAVLTLWQTNPLRSTRLRVIDEVANGLSYYDHTFLAGLPRFYADLEEELAGAGVALARGLPSFLRLGSWIGGDRDGNPFVTEGVLRAALQAQSGRALNYYLDELHKLGGELSLDSRLVGVSDALAELAARSPDRSANRQHEPYRRAITGIYARLAATARVLDGLEAPQHAVGDAPPYRDSGELLADLSILDSSLVANGSEILAKGRLKDLRRAVDVFGFHLAALDLRQNSDVHERTVGEMLGLVQPGLDYAALAEPERIRLLLTELATARPLSSPFLSYSAETESEVAILRATAEAHRRYGPSSVPHYVISKTTGVSDILETAVLLKEAGLLRPRDGALDLDIVPLFETIEDLRNCSTVMDELLGLPGIRAPARKPRPRAGGHARLFGQQQGWRFPDFRLGALQGGDRAGRGVPPSRRQAAPVPRPRRLGRPRRRAQLPGDPRAARRRGSGRNPHHRAGRGHRQQILEPRARPAQSGDPRRGDARSHLAAAGDGRPAGPIIWRRWTTSPPRPIGPIAASSTKPTVSTASSASRR